MEEENVTGASDIVETIQKLSGASHGLSRIEASQIHKIAETSKVVMAYGIAKLVSEVAMSPMLFELSADGTPTVVFNQHSSRMPSGKVAHRKAKQTEEFPVRNRFVRCTLPDGRVGTRGVVHDPVLLKHGKGAHAIVEVLGRDWKTGRQLPGSGLRCALNSKTQRRQRK